MQDIPQKQAAVTLITGASGFLGAHVTNLLSKQGKKIRALYHKTPPTQSLASLPGVIWISCDLLDVFDIEQVLENVSDVYHCAAVVSFHPQQKQNLLHFNIESTANLVNESLIQKIRKFVFVSSTGALGKGTKDRLINEDAQWEENEHASVYGRSKYLAEMEVWRGIAEGLNAVIINPGIILGAPFQKKTSREEKDFWDTGSARLMKVVNSEFPFYTHGVTGWVDVLDVAKVMSILMDSEISGERFIVVEGNYSYRHIFSEMAVALEKKPPYIPVGKFLTECIWRWSMMKSTITGKKITVTKETARAAQKLVRYDNQKLRAALAGKFSFRPLKETILTMAKAFKEKE